MHLYFLIAVVCAGGTSWGATLEEAEAAYKKGRYEQALEPFVLAAVKGNSLAQYRLGEMYGLGHGVRQDSSKAIAWYGRAAAQGELDAQNNLGAIYYDQRDYGKALAWFLKAAKAGNAAAQFNVGNMYYNGDGVTRNYTEAARWYQKASERGDARAQNNLGFMYAGGQGVAKQDYVEAYKWYLLASAQGNETARRSMETLGARMSPEQMMAAKERASHVPAARHD